MKAFITGITGQDGSYLAEFLLEKGYEVHGLIRRSSLIKTDRIDHIFDQLHLHYGDMTDALGLASVLEKVQPDEIYNLAAQSHVAVSFETPAYTANADALGTLNLLELLRTRFPKARFYQASTSELFGSTPPPQSEESIFRPRSPYAAAKLYAYWLVRNYREAYDLFAVNGILFNHESPRRGETFVTRKVVRHVVHTPEKVLEIGNLLAVRDWSHAKDMVEGMWDMLQHHEPEDFVLGSGVGYTVQTFIDLVYTEQGIPLTWEVNDEGFGSAYDEEGNVRVQSVDRYFRPLEVDALVADTSKAQSEIDWRPQYDLFDLIKEMLDAEHDLAVGNK